MLLECRSAAVGPVVLTVRVAGVVVVAVAVTEQTGAGLAVVVMLQVRFTVPAKPPVPLTAIVDVADFPADTVAEAGLAAASVKLPPPEAVTTSVTVAVLLTEPEVPVMVTGVEPAVVDEVVVIVRADVTGLAPGVTDGGTKAHAAPVGRPVQVRPTALVKPPDGVIVTVEVAEAPAAIETGESAVAATPKLAPLPAGCLKAATCITHAALPTWVAVASKGPTTVGKACSTLLPSGVKIAVA
jgi:hypothetical protein